jgi:hypothetical protein
LQGLNENFFQKKYNWKLTIMMVSVFCLGTFSQG